jgi:hypothetical protein
MLKRQSKELKWFKLFFHFKKIQFYLIFYDKILW